MVTMGLLMEEDFFDIKTVIIHLAFITDSMGLAIEVIGVGNKVSIEASIAHIERLASASFFYVYLINMLISN